jgi:hypothetical protein
MEIVKSNLNIELDSDKYFDNEKEQKLVKTFNRILKQFIKELGISFSEFNINNIKEYKNIDEKDDKFILYFMKNIELYIKQLAELDETMFEKENIFLLRDVNFNLIWSTNISDINKKAIWKFLQTMYLIGKPFSSNKEDIKSLIEDYNKKMIDETDTLLLKTIKIEINYIYKIIQNLNKSKEEDKSSTPNNNTNNTDNEKLPDFLKNSKIGKLAQELSSELNIDELGFSDSDNPQDIFKNIIGKNPQKLMGLIQSIGTKIQDKLSEENLSQEELLGEAKEMMSSLGGNEMISNIFKDPKMKGMFENMSKMFGTDLNANDFENIANQFTNGGFNNGNGNQKTQVDHNKINNMKTKERLKTKLKKKLETKEEMKNGEVKNSNVILSETQNAILDSSIEEVLNSNSQTKIIKKKKKKKKLENNKDGMQEII